MAEREIDKIVIHCSDSTWGCREVIHGWHTDPKPNGRGWSDIGYHYVIPNGRPHLSNSYDPEWDGFLETGRAIRTIGAHARGANRHGFGICLIGTGAGLFTPRQMITLAGAVRSLQVSFDIPDDHVIGHRDIDSRKTCPGFDVAAWMRGLR